MARATHLATGSIEAVPSRLQRLVAWVAAASMVLLIALIDRLTGTEISLSIFYLAPIGILAWNGSLATAIGIAVASAGAWLWADLSGGHAYSSAAIPFWNSAVRLGFFLLGGLAVRRVRELSRRERQLARTDSLTGLLNRRAFYEHLDIELRRGRRTGRPLTVGFVDLDDFKRVNDQHGHLSGDRLLETFGRVLATALRATDTVARLGGDEFGLILPETDRAQAARAMARAREALRAALDAGGWRATASVGLLTCLDPRIATEPLMAAVDRVMYRAKSLGKDQVVQDELATDAAAAPTASESS